MSKQILNGSVLIILLTFLTVLVIALWPDLNLSHLILLIAIFIFKITIEFSKQVSNE